MSGLRFFEDDMHRLINAERALNGLYHGIREQESRLKQVERDGLEALKYGVSHAPKSLIAAREGLATIQVIKRGIQ